MLVHEKYKSFITRPQKIALTREKKIFDLLDADKNGSIDKEEFEKMHGTGAVAEGPFWYEDEIMHLDGHLSDLAHLESAVFRLLLPRFAEGLHFEKCFRYC